MISCIADNFSTFESEQTSIHSIDIFWGQNTYLTTINLEKVKTTMPSECDLSQFDNTVIYIS